jgi:hypothetical protein
LGEFKGLSCKASWHFRNWAPLLNVAGFPIGIPNKLLISSALKEVKSEVDFSVLGIDPVEGRVISTAKLIRIAFASGPAAVAIINESRTSMAIVGSLWVIDIIG